MVDILLSFLPSDTVQNLSDLYETCEREKAEIVGLPGGRSLSPRMTYSRAPVLSCATMYFQAPATEARKILNRGLNRVLQCPSPDPKFRAIP